MYINFNEMLKEYVGIKVMIDPDTDNILRKIAAASDKTRQQTAYMLINTALRYNFDSNLDYICCHTQNTAYLKRKKQNRSRNIKLYVRKDRLDILHKLQNTLCIPGISSTLRKLIEIALEYDYNEHLTFCAPTPLFTPNDKESASTIADFIQIDFL